MPRMEDDALLTSPSCDLAIERFWTGGNFQRDSLPSTFLRQLAILRNPRVQSFRNRPERQDFCLAAGAADLAGEVHGPRLGKFRAGQEQATQSLSGDHRRSDRLGADRIAVVCGGEKRRFGKDRAGRSALQHHCTATALVADESDRTRLDKEHGLNRIVASEKAPVRRVGALLIRQRMKPLDHDSNHVASRWLMAIEAVGRQC